MYCAACKKSGIQNTAFKKLLKWVLTYRPGFITLQQFI